MRFLQIDCITDFWRWTSWFIAVLQDRSSFCDSPQGKIQPFKLTYEAFCNTALVTLIQLIFSTFCSGYLHVPITQGYTGSLALDLLSCCTLYRKNFHRTHPSSPISVVSKLWLMEQIWSVVLPLFVEQSFIQTQPFTYSLWLCSHYNCQTEQLEQRQSGHKA